MIATYLNRYNDSVYTYHDLHFSENNVSILRVVGVGFDHEPTYEELSAFAYTFVENNLPDYTLENTIID
jgi:hypothetical protein